MLFKFISERPSPSIIWHTLNDTTIQPSAGYTVQQIKFMMFIILVMHDFKEAKQMCNDFLESKPAHILTTAKKYLEVSDSDIKSIAEPPLDLPIFVAEQFYLPYYYLLQVCDATDSILWLDLFDRNYISPDEYKVIKSSHTSLHTSITKYNMWKQNLPISFSLNEVYADIFIMNMNLSPVHVKVKADIHGYLRKAIYDVVDEKLIYDYSERIVIPPFKLVTEETPDEA